MNGSDEGDGRESGFTLVELLVAIALLALISGFAAVGISQLNRMRQAEENLAADAEVEAVADHLRNAVASARPLVLAQDGNGMARLAFAGRSNRLSIVTSGEARLETGGLHAAEYVLEERDGQRALVTRRALFRPLPDSLLPAADTLVLLRNLRAINFRYFGAPADGESARSFDTWPESDRLPLLVEISLAFPDGDRRRWPILMVAIAGAR